MTYRLYILNAKSLEKIEINKNGWDLRPVKFNAILELSVYSCWRYLFKDDSKNIGWEFSNVSSWSKTHLLRRVSKSRLAAQPFFWLIWHCPVAQANETNRKQKQTEHIKCEWDCHLSIGWCHLGTFYASCQNYWEFPIIGSEEED